MLLVRGGGVDGGREEELAYLFQRYNGRLLQSESGPVSTDLNLDLTRWGSHGAGSLREC